MKVTVIVSMLVIAVMLAPTSSARPAKRAVAPWVPIQMGGINFILTFVPYGPELTRAVDKIITAAGTTPFSISDLLSSIFNMTEQAVELGKVGPNKSLVSLPQLTTLFTAISTLVIDATNGKVRMLSGEINNVVCAAEALAGLTKCNSMPLTNLTTKLMTDATNHAPPSTIITDTFAIVTASINLGASSSTMPASIIAAMQELITSVCTLVVVSLDFNTIDASHTITAVLTDAKALGKL